MLTPEYGQESDLTLQHLNCIDIKKSRAVFGQMRTECSTVLPVISIQEFELLLHKWKIHSDVPFGQTEYGIKKASTNGLATSHLKQHLVAVV